MNPGHLVLRRRTTRDEVAPPAIRLDSSTRCRLEKVLLDSMQTRVSPADSRKSLRLEKVLRLEGSPGLEEVLDSREPLEPIGGFGFLKLNP